MRFCQLSRSKGLGAVALAWAAAMPACAMPVDDGCAGLNCELNTSSPEPVNSSEEALVQGPHPELAGQRMKSPAHPAVFLIDPEGYKRWIPNPATYNNLFVDWAGIYVDADVIYIDQGPSLSDGAFLAKASNSAAVYLVSNGQKRWITSPAVMNKYYFNWGAINVLPPAYLEAVPTGPNWY